MLVKIYGANSEAWKIENHDAAVALGYFVYTFIKIHRTLRCRPTIAPGVTDRLLEVSDLVALLEADDPAIRRSDVESGV
jgi:hypothetical protein